MRDHSGYIEKTRHEAMQDVLDTWEFTRRVERVDVPDALGRVAAVDVFSLNTLPNKLTSNMDGIAVRFDAFEAAGPDGSDTSMWVRGRDWQFCNTGIGMPDDFDTAIAIEGVEVSDDNEHVVLHRLPERRGQSTTPIGANLREGDLLVRAGEQLTVFVPENLDLRVDHQGMRSHISPQRPVIFIIGSCLHALKRNKQGASPAEILFLGLRAFPYASAGVDRVGEIQNENGFHVFLM